MATEKPPHKSPKPPAKNTELTIVLSLLASTSMGLAVYNPVLTPLASTVVTTSVGAIVALNRK
jgi:hypothetical protein